MKNPFLSALLAVLFSSLTPAIAGERGNPKEPLSDSVPYAAVLIEDFLGTWCNNCPPVTDSIAKLTEDFGNRLQVIGYHTNENRSDVLFLYNMDTWERSCYYDTIRSVPAVFINGEKLAGTNKLREKVQEKMNRKTPYSLDLEARHYPLRESCRDSFEIHVKIKKTAQDTVRKLRLHLSFTQDHLPFAWYNQTEVNHANTFMYPDGKGSEVTLDPNREAEFSFAFSIAYQDSRLLMNNAHLTAFLQDERIIRYDTLYNGSLKAVKDNTILQTAVADFSKGDLSYGTEKPLQPDFHAWQTELADGEKIQFHDNSFGDNTLLWTFEGGEPESSQDAHPVVTYAKPGNYPVSLQVKAGEEVRTYTRENFIHVLDVKPKFRIEPNPARPNQTIRLEVLSQADSCEWRFFGGSPFLSYGKTAEVKFPLEGMFNVQLKTFYESPSTGILYAYDSTSVKLVEIRADAATEKEGTEISEEKIHLTRISGSRARYRISASCPIDYAEIYSIDGTCLSRTRGETLDLENQASGLYILLVKPENGKPVSFKLIR